MKIGLVDVDSHNFPNLPLMKLSAYHKAKGDTVEWCNFLCDYDIVYKSRVFDDTYSQDEQTVIRADKIISGGTGSGNNDTLPDEVEHIYPDYSLYNCKESYGFLTRGCPRGCKFCIVSEKEGRQSKRVAHLSEFWRGQKEIVLLDPNLLACCEHESILQELADSKAWIDFTQGLDIRLINFDNIKLIKRLKIKQIHFAWDNPKEDLTDRFIWFKESTGYDYRKMSVYVLTNFNSTHEEDLHRVLTLRDLGYNPDVRIYDKPNAPEETNSLQRWVNNRRIFRTINNFADYDRKLG